MSKIAILGTGSWASGRGQVLCDNGQEVLLYGIDDKEIEDLNLRHENSKYFPGVDIHPGVKATKDLAACLDQARYLVVTIPTQFVRSVLTQVEPLLKEKVIIINASKGFDDQYNMPMSDTIRDVIGEDKREAVVSLIGPSHAEEVVLRMLTCVCAVSVDNDISLEVQHLFSNDYFRVYRSDDEKGAEYSVALKNVIALAAGCIYGLGYGDNTRAALITRGLHEMMRYGLKKGGRFETYLGLTGIGDLVVTCSSKHSRNFQAGYEIGKNNNAAEFMAHNTKTVEGIRTCKVVYEDLKNYPDIEMPITTAIYHVLYENSCPEEEIRQLMLRELKAEI